MSDDELLAALRSGRYEPYANSVAEARLRALIAERDELEAAAEFNLKLLGGVVTEREKAKAEAARLRAAIQAVIDGDYPNPRDHRPGQCKHGREYYEDCGSCVDEFLTAALATEGVDPKLDTGRKTEDAP
jgi:hypothetical protein